MADGLLNKASIILTPTGYKAGTLYNVAPIDEPYEDFDFARTSTATRINSSGLVSNVATGVPRISYDSNGENGHILLEPTSTNLVPYSENFSDSSWTKSQLTESLSNINSPDGTQNAYKLTESNSSSKHQIFRSIASYTELTISFFAKKAERSFISVEKSSWGTTVFNLNDGSVVSGNGSVVDFGNGWYRCSASYTASPAQSQFYILLMQDGTTTNYQGDGTSGLYLFGVQAEALSYATSYIPTLTGSTETRATETATGAGSADLINSTEGVLYAEIAGLVDADASDRVISLSDNSITNRVEMKLSSSGSIQGRFDSAADDITLTEAGVTASNFNKIALVWSSGKCALFINGVKEQEDLTFNTFASDVLLDLSFDSAYLGGSSNFYGKCKALAVFNEALSDSELTQLTT
jgi:hypothetical protein